MSDTSSQKKAPGPYRGPRTIIALIYFAVGMVLILIFIIFLREQVFYFNAEANSFHFFRYAWCLASSFIGFFVVALVARDHSQSPCPSYIAYYPPFLVAISALIFSVLHLFSSTSGFVFYYLSFALCFILGYLVDWFERWAVLAINKVIEKAVK